MKTSRTTRQYSRLHNSHPWLRSWLTQSHSSGRHISSARPLVCEPLERRYALDGMGWMDGADDVWEYRQTTVVYPDGSSADVIQVRAWNHVAHHATRPEPKLTSGFSGRYLVYDQYVLGEGEDFGDYTEADDCDHPLAGLGRGEGEASSDLGGRDFGGRDLHRTPLGDSIRGDLSPGSRNGNDPTRSNNIAGSNSQHQLDLAPSAHELLSIAAAQLALTLPASVATASTTHSNSVSSPAATTGPTVALGPTANPTQTTGIDIQLSNFLASMNARSNSSEATSGARQTASVRVNGGELGSFSSRDGATPALVIPKAEIAATASQAVSNARQTTAGHWQMDSHASDNLHEFSSLVGSHTRDRSPGSWHNSGQDNSGQTDGVLRKLQSVIDQLANRRQTDKADAPWNKNNGRPGDGYVESTASRVGGVNDGLLEFAPGAEKLPVVSVPLDQVSQVATHPYDRGQLIAALELNREFELAGQSMPLIRSVIDPAKLLEQANLAADEIHQDDSQIDALPEPTVDGTPAEATLWQRTLLPLGFLAIGGLLIRSRQKYRHP